MLPTAAQANGRRWWSNRRESRSGNRHRRAATATVNNLQLSLSESQLLTTLLGLNATTIQSFSQANSVGRLDASGSTTIEGLTLYGLLLGGVTIDGSLFVNPAPNTVLLNIAGLLDTQADAVGKAFERQGLHVADRGSGEWPAVVVEST